MAKTTDEKTHVKIRFVEQMKGMGWDHIDGDLDVPYLNERETLGIAGKKIAIREDTLFYPAEEKLS